MGSGWLVLGAIIVFVAVVAGLIYDYQHNPFLPYPRFYIYFDISGMRKPDYQEQIDLWVIEHKDFDSNSQFEDLIRDWEKDCKEIYRKTIFFKKHKKDLFQFMKSEIQNYDYQAFYWFFYRLQTRYKQHNYVREPYTVKRMVYKSSNSLRELLNIYDELEEIDFETTRKKYESKNQRKLMTKELRQKIKVRDNFTCQICGKYMPDEVGLHIDHIRAIKDGGKTVESNLQVLCDKCNLKKQ